MTLSSYKKISALFTGIPSNNNVFTHLEQKNKYKKHKNVCENHDYCYIEMLKEYNKIVKYIHGKKL